MSFNRKTFASSSAALVAALTLASTAYAQPDGLESAVRFRAAQEGAAAIKLTVVAPVGALTRAVAESGATASNVAAERKAPPCCEKLAAERKPPVGDYLAAERKPPVGDWLAAERKAPGGDNLAAERKPPVGDWLAAERKAPGGDNVAAERKPPVGDKLAAE